MDSTSDDFVFLTPRPVKKEKKKESRSNKPWPPSKAAHQDDEEDMLWRKGGVYDQLSRTREKIEAMTVRDDEFAYYLLEMVNNVDHPTSMKVLERLGARILCHVNPARNAVLVEAPLERLKTIVEGKHLSDLESNVHLVRPLRASEKVWKAIPDAEWAKRNMRIIVELMPNIDKEKRYQYLDKVSSYLLSLGLKSVEGPADHYLRSNGFIVSVASVSQAKDIADRSNIVYRIFKTPKLKKSSIQRKIKPRIRLSRLQSDKSYRVCVVDTGINNIAQIAPLVESSSFESFFADGTDMDNHGTPVSCLVARGEGQDAARPLFKILSHRVFSEVLGQGDLFNGLINAIALYKDKTKVFISSCVFEDDSPEVREATSVLSRLIYEQNVCVVFSAGNINPPYNSTDYPRYIADNKVNHPSDALAITSVGSIVKRANALTFAPVNGPSPFSRLGCSCSTNLYKPEVVQHGGNSTQDGDKAGLGVRTFSNTGLDFEDCGTSFASPLFARILSNVYCCYEGRFQNAETARAIAYSSCSKNNFHHPEYLGFGEGNLDDSVSASWNNAKIVFEGSMPLGHSEGDVEYDTQDEIRFNVPAGVSQIRLTIVHTDDYSRYLAEPRLNSYLMVKTWKPGSESSVKPASLYPKQLAHAKKLNWQYSRGTVGAWKFEIHPRSIDIPKEERKDVTIRYGAVIELRARKSEIRSLTERLKQANGLP